MLPMAHVSAAYLVSQIPIKGKSLRWKEVLLVIFAGIIFDFDTLLPQVLGYPLGSHHLLFTHTPLMGLVYFLILLVIFRKRFKKKVWILVGLALLSHLILDDLAYWLYLLGYSDGSPRPQIFWLYPFDQRRNGEIERFIQNYGGHSGFRGWMEIVYAFSLRMAKMFWIEVGLRVAAVVVFVGVNWKKIGRL